MNKHFCKLLMILAAMVLPAAGVLSGCAGSGQGTTPPSSSTPAVESPDTANDASASESGAGEDVAGIDPSVFVKPAGNVEISMWYAISGESGEALLKLIDAYQQANPNIIIEASYSGDYNDTQTKISANLSTNNAPDIVVVSAGPKYTGGRGDYTIEALIEDPAFDKDDIFDGIWEYSTYKGRKCAIPFGSSTPVMYYNKSIIEAAEIDLSTPPKTWDAFFDIATLAQENGNVQNSPAFYGFETNDPTWLFNTMMGQTGNSMVEIDGEDIQPTFNQDGAIKAAEFWKRMADSGLMPVNEHENAENVFLSGNSAFFVASSGRIPRFSESEMEIDAIPMPAFDQAKVALGGNMLVTFSTEHEKLAASWDVIKYLTNTENHAQFSLESGYLPIRQSSVALDVMQQAIEENPLVAVSFGQLENTWAYTWFDEESVMYSCIRRAVETFEAGEEAQVALDNAAKDFLREL